MPRHLLIACTTASITFTTQAALAPSYEKGLRIYFAPLLFIGAVAYLVAFMRRKQWTWRSVYWGSLWAVAINALFFPTVEFYGGFTTAARVIAVVQILACVVIFFSMQSATTKAWFRARPSVVQPDP